MESPGLKVERFGRGLLGKLLRSSTKRQAREERTQKLTPGLMPIQRDLIAFGRDLPERLLKLLQYWGPALFVLLELLAPKVQLCGL